MGAISDVTGRDEIDAATDTRAVNGRDHRLGTSLDRSKRVLEFQHEFVNVKGLSRNVRAIAVFVVVVFQFVVGPRSDAAR